MVYKISSDLISVLSSTHAILHVKKPKLGEKGLNTTARQGEGRRGRAGTRLHVFWFPSHLGWPASSSCFAWACFSFSTGSPASRGCAPRPPHPRLAESDGNPSPVLGLFCSFFLQAQWVRVEGSAMSQGVEGLAPVSGRSAAVPVCQLFTGRGLPVLYVLQMKEVKSAGRIICCIKGLSFWGQWFDNLGSYVSAPILFYFSTVGIRTSSTQNAAPADSYSYVFPSVSNCTAAVRPQGPTHMALG